MNGRLPFRLPEYEPRVIWSSATAREIWQPRIAAVSRAWLLAERESVAAGIRPSALQNVTTEELPVLMKELAPRGLIVLPLAQTTRTQGYQSATRPARVGEVLDYRCAITRPEHAAEWADAWNRSDDDAIGKLLGTPECCRRFFDRVWKQERWMDTTVSMSTPLPNGTVMHSEWPEDGLNMLWRWQGDQHEEARLALRETAVDDGPSTFVLGHRQSSSARPPLRPPRRPAPLVESRRPCPR